MPRRPEWIIGGFYHVFNRGANRQTIFFDRDNYLHFLKLIRRHLFDQETDGLPSASDELRVESDALRPIDIAAYCLMPNHFHLLVRLNRDDLSERMKSLAQAYVEAVNRRFERSGPLFEGRFRAILVDDEAYLWQLSRYIHLNPVEAGLVARASDWEYSSYPEYVGERIGTLPHPALVLKDFGETPRYRRFVEGQAIGGPDLRPLLFDE